MKRLSYILALILCISVSHFVASAQIRTVGGTVKDSDGVPMPGVSVMLSGNGKVGAVTDIDGKWSLGISGKSPVIVFSFLGMETQEVKVADGQKTVNVTMKEVGTMLDQVVITGYTQTSTKKMTGSVEVLTTKDLIDKPQSSVDAMLQGQLAGVSVTATSGQPGRSQEIRIRGQATLTGDQSPLWVVDGVPLQGGMPNVSDSQLKTGGLEDFLINGVGDINPNDIENISILKDASAAAIYGSRAANGVIVVTTKRGSDGPMHVNYSGNVSVTFRPQRDAALMNSSEKIDWEQELWDEFSAERFGGGKTYPVVGIVGMVRSGYGKYAAMAGDKDAQDKYLEGLKSRSTNWFDEIFRNSVSTNHHLNISGGSKKYNYYVGIGYTHDAGLLIRDDYNRYNLKSNFTFTPNRILKLDLGLDISRQESKAPNLSDVDPFSYAYYANPYEYSYNEDGSYRADETWQVLNQANGSSVMPVYNKGYNIMRELNETSSKTGNWANTARAGAEVKFLEQLKFVGLLSWSFANNRTEKINPKNSYAAWSEMLDYDKSFNSSLCYGSIIQNSLTRNSFIARGHLAYNQEFADGAHALSVIAGAEVRGENSNTLYAKRLNYDSNTQTTSMPQPPTGKSQLESWLREVEQLSGEYWSKSRYASFYASGDYFLLNRYILNFSFRTDGSSYFGSKKQFNPTWSVGAAWHIQQEKWMQWASSWLDRLILRAATGFTGNINNGVAPQLVMSYWQQQYRKYDGESLDIATFSGTPNPNLGWEKTQDYKLSLEWGLFGERLSGVIEGYKRVSTDVVVSSRIPSITGYTYQKYNSADISNSGIEFTLNGRLLDTRDWKINASVNFSYNYNIVTRYDSVDKMTSSTRYWVGYPVNALFIGKLDGLNSEGLYKFELRPDAEITKLSDYQNADNYRFYLGTGTAPYTGGFNLSVAWKGLSLSCFAAYSAGAKTFENPAVPGSYGSITRTGADPERPQTVYSDLYTNHFNVRRDRTDRWTETNRNAKYPRIYDAYGTAYNFDRDNPFNSDIIRGAYVKDNSYLRIKNIILSYSLPQSAVKKMKMTSFRMNLSLNNFFTFTDYDGLDPETPGAVYPVSRSATFGLVIGF